MAKGSTKLVCTAWWHRHKCSIRRLCLTHDLPITSQTHNHNVTEQHGVQLVATVLFQYSVLMALTV